MQEVSVLRNRVPASFCAIRVRFFFFFLSSRDQKGSFLRFDIYIFLLEFPSIVERVSVLNLIKNSRPK